MHKVQFLASDLHTSHAEGVVLKLNFENSQISMYLPSFLLFSTFLGKKSFNFFGEKDKKYVTRSITWNDITWFKFDNTVTIKRVIFNYCHEPISLWYKLRRTLYAKQWYRRFVLLCIFQRYSFSTNLLTNQNKRQFQRMVIK